MLSIGRRTTSPTTVARGAWAQLLDEDDSRAESLGMGAGVIVIGFTNELLRNLDNDDRALTEAAILSIINRSLGWTDRTATVAPGRLGVVVLPVESPLALSRQARDIHRDLRTCDLDIDVSYAMRRNHGGLHAAAARADAAMDTALARR